MKRLTISLDDKLYFSLVDYAAERSKKNMSRLSVSRTITELISNELASLGYYATPEAKKRLVAKEITN
jgi:hypothetical protein